MAFEPEKHEDGLDKDGEAGGDQFEDLTSRISRANNNVSCSKVENHSLTQMIYKVTQFKMPCGTYDVDPLF